MATCVDVAKATYPSRHNDQAILPMEGKSLLGAFANQQIDRESLYLGARRKRGVRVKDMKLVRKGRNAPWELYDLANDRTELKNLAEEKADIANDLAAKWEACRSGLRSSRTLTRR